MTTYGNERGARMAANALAHGDELTTMTNQAYGEWKPDYAGQMDFGTLRTEPTLQTLADDISFLDGSKENADMLFSFTYHTHHIFLNNRETTDFS